MDAAVTFPTEENSQSGIASDFDFYALKRLCKREVIDIDRNGKICGYTKKKLRKFLDSPQHHSAELMSVIRFIAT